MVEKLEKFGCVFCLVLMASVMTLASMGCAELKHNSVERVVKQLKGAKILTVQDYDKINPLDQFGWPVTMAEEPSEYDRIYPKRLKEYLGIDIKIVRLKELNQEIEKITEKEAENRNRRTSKRIRRIYNRGNGNICYRINLSTGIQFPVFFILLEF